MKTRTAFTYGTEGQSGWKHDRIAELLQAFDLSYDPDMNEYDLIKISNIEHDTLSLQSV